MVMLIFPFGYNNWLEEPADFVDWYDKVVSNYKYYKQYDTHQRKELRDGFEKYLSQ